MPSEVRVVVIGAGALGLSTAWHLVRAGHRDVTVLEAGAVACGSSSRSVGMVETQYLDAYEVDMRAYGRRVFDDLERRHGLPFAHEGYLRLAHDDDDLAAYERSAAYQAAAGCDGRVVGPGEVARLVPDLAPGAFAGGLFGPTDGYVDGHRYCSLLADLVRAGGGCVITGCPVLGAEPGRGSSVAVAAASSPARVFEADVVVNAAGAWAAQVGDLLGARVPLVPQLHEVVSIELGEPLGYVMPFVIDYVPGSGGEGVYVRRERDRQLLAGLHTDEAVHEQVPPDTPLGAPSHEFQERLARRLVELLPGLGDPGIGPGWSGLYPTSPDGRPVVGPHPEVAGMICALGAGGSGIQLSPAVGRAAAEFCLSGGSTSVSRDSTWSAARLTS